MHLLIAVFQAYGSNQGVKLKKAFGSFMVPARGMLQRDSSGVTFLRRFFSFSSDCLRCKGQLESAQNGTASQVFKQFFVRNCTLALKVFFHQREEVSEMEAN